MVKISSFSNNLYQRQFPVSIYSNRISSIVVYIVLATMVIDTILNQHEEVRFYLRTYSLEIVLFVALAALAIAGQYYILEFVKYKSREIRNKVLHTNISYKITAILQYLVIADFIVLIVGIVIFSQYPTLSLAFITGATYGLNISLMSAFTIIFFSWYIK
jgi:hypothetical protein